MPTNGEYPPSQYGEYNNEYNPQFGYVHRNGGIGNDMHPTTTESARMMMSTDDPGSGDRRSHLGRADDDDEGGMMDTNVDDDEVDDEFAPIPIQYSPRSATRKDDGNSLPKFDFR